MSLALSVSRHFVHSAVGLIKAEVTTTHARRRDVPTRRRRHRCALSRVHRFQFISRRREQPQHSPGRSDAMTNYLPSKQIRRAPRRSAVRLYGSSPALKRTAVVAPVYDVSSQTGSDISRVVKASRSSGCQSHVYPALSPLPSSSPS